MRDNFFSPVGAVVVTYRNTDEQLEGCLAGLRDSGVRDIKVVDNNEDNLGFATAANKGAFELDNDYIFFINPDARLLPGSLNKAVRFLEKRDDVGVVGLMLCRDDGCPEMNCFGDRVCFKSMVLRRLRAKKLPIKSRAVGWVSGGAMLARRVAWEELGGFDNRFFMYWEDVDVCHRALEAGWEVRFLPQAKVLHERGSSWEDEREKTKYYDISADKFFHKHYSKPIWFGQRYLRVIYRFFSRSAD